VVLDHRGGGTPWATASSLAAVPLRDAVARGYSIRRSVEPLVQASPGNWRRGDVARVTLEITAQSDMTWVVVDDPVPAGATILGSGFATDSTLLSQSADTTRLVPTFEERAFDAVRAYYAFVPRGTWQVSYAVRYNTPGGFLLPPTRVEAMYAPEMHGEIPNPGIEISR
jgi:hypothetical protein